MKKALISLLSILLVLPLIACAQPAGAGLIKSDKLRESEERLRVMFESIADGILICDVNGYIVDCNNAAAQLYGYAHKEEIIGQDFLGLIIAKDRPKVEKAREAFLKSGRNCKREYACLKKDGTGFDVEMSIALLGNGVGKPTGLVVVSRDITQQKRDRQNMSYFISRITGAQEDERRRIARELHDQTIQSLASLSLDLETFLSDENGLSVVKTEQLRQVGDKLRSIIRDVRRFSQDLRPDILDRLGLVPALEVLVEELNKEGIIEAHIEVVNAERRLSQEMELALFRVVQEALHNVRRHSQATAATIRLELDTKALNLSITDNGKGFRLLEMKSDWAGEGKLGLIGMQERTHLLDGDFSLTSDIGKGTTVAVKVPLTDWGR